ncbi:MAG: hypothetical protein E7359_01430 [Clostridiales bacterium]|nr:hypothetical protein [Clostridiales bacterium]
MSYFEYDDLYLKAQQNKNAKYIAFCFDISNSKLMESRERLTAQIKSFETIDLVIKCLNKLEDKENKKILLDEKPVQKVESIIKTKDKTFSYLNNPCVLFGDSFVFYCYNKSISPEDFLKIFQACCNQARNKTKYHFNLGHFETLNYEDANKQYYIGYIAEKIAKEKTHIKTF